MTQRLIACVTFDFDAMSGLVARGLTSATPVSRGEFGAVAMPRVLALLERFWIRTSTWPGPRSRVSWAYPISSSRS